MKNQKGVTLIALVVTIIVLIILAGVSIAILTGDNGVINRSKDAQKETIRGEVRDKITLALASAKMLAEQQTVQSAGFSAQTNLTAEPSMILNELRGELNGWNGTTPLQGSAASGQYVVALATTDPSEGKNVTITYTSTAYNQAMNKSASISVTVNVTGNVFKIDPTSWTYGES